jgi:hypothetical protein
VALLEKRRYLNNRSGDFPQVILIVPSHVPNISFELNVRAYCWLVRGKKIGKTEGESSQFINDDIYLPIQLFLFPIYIFIYEISFETHGP